MIPILTRQRLRLSVLSALALLILANPGLRATTPPSRAELEQYRKDGSLPARIKAAKEMGNHLLKPEVREQLHYRLKKAALEQQGATQAEIDLRLTPPPAWQGMPTKGTVKIPCLLISFSDYPSTNSTASIESKLFGDGTGSAPYESLRNFYRRASYNQLEIQGNVLGWYQASYPRSNVTQTRTGREKLIKEVINYYKAQGHNFAQYDNNGDGVIDYLPIVWTGPDTGWGNFWWGYQTEFADQSFTVDGKKIGSYSWQWEAQPYPGTFSPRVMIHETGHALGLPDYYDYDDEIGPVGGVGGLDQMDGNWGDHNCFSKFVLDWITPTVATGPRTGINLLPSGTDKDALLVMPDAVAGQAFGEFFMVQYRKRVANDTPIPNDGLLIWHVDSRLDASGWDYIYDNSYAEHKLLRLMEADGLEEIERGYRADADDFYNTGKSFGSRTTPNNLSYDGLFPWLAVSNISAPGTSMSFDLLQESPDASAPSGAPTTPVDEGTENTQDRLQFIWTQGTAADLDSGITGYYLQLGQTPGGSDLFDGRVGNKLEKVLEHSGVDGKLHYARVRAMNGAGLYSAWSGNSDGIKLNLPLFADGAAALDAPSMVFKTWGNAGWKAQGTTQYFGASAAESGVLDDEEASWMGVGVTGPGSLNFHWKVSSEKDYDYLFVTVDGVLQAYVSGEVDWTPKTLQIPAGDHFVRWVYAKDEAVKEGQDKAWVDKVEFSTTSADPRITQQPQSLTVQLGQAASFSVTAAGTAPINYQWRKNSSTISNAIASSYTIPSVTNADAGSYDVMVSNSLGLVTSSPATLTIGGQALPIISSFAADPTSIFNGSNSTLSWSVSGASSLSLSGIGSVTGTSRRVTPTATTSYILTATNGGGNVNSSPVTVSVRPAELLDLAGLAKAWGSAHGDAAYLSAYDLNSDGLVNDADVALFYQVF